MRFRYAMADGGHTDAIAGAAWFTPVLATLSAVLGAFGLWLANRMLGKAAFQTAINAGFKDLTDQLQEERQAMLKERTEERLAWAAERAQLRGEIINLTQAVESLKNLLRRNGIEVPMSNSGPSAAMTIIEGDQK